jgi:hypothetical protein
LHTFFLGAAEKAVKEAEATACAGSAQSSGGASAVAPLQAPESLKFSSAAALIGNS